MADRRDLLLARKMEDLRRKVFEPAAIIGASDMFRISMLIPTTRSGTDAATVWSARVQT
jgi:hypothetical protein